MSDPIVRAIPLAVCLGLAVAWDVRARKIPNAVIGVAAALGLFSQLWDGGVLSMLSGLAAGAIAIVLLFSFWTRGGLGGGDVKLAGAVAMGVGLRLLPVFALGTALAGGATAVVCLWLSKAQARNDMRANLLLTILHRDMPSVTATDAGRVSVPYAVAIAVGALCARIWPHFG